MSQIIDTVSRLNPLVQLLSDDYQNRFVGYTYKIDYETLSLLTNDHWKEKVHGVQQNGFLLASAIQPERFSATPEVDKEILLLRVMSHDKLPEYEQHVNTIIQNFQKRTQIQAEHETEGFDPWTKGYLQWGAIQCRILGTFYIDANGKLKLGSDIENFTSHTHLKVYKPIQESLEMIVNYLDPINQKKALSEIQKQGFAKLPPPIEVGFVRYTSSRRLQEHSGIPSVPVKINSADFLAKRTACFGMTRTGKSNQVKTIVSAVKMASIGGNVPVGQLIFDLNGEYANANYQDQGSSISEVFQADTLCYRGIDSPQNRGQFRDLRNNFYEALVPGLNTLKALMASENHSSSDIKNFLGLELEEPDRRDMGAHNRWQVCKAAYLCLLKQAGFAVGDDVRVSIPAGKNVKRQIYAHTIQDKAAFEALSKSEQEREAEEALGQTTDLTLDEAIRWFNRVRRANRELIKNQRNEKKDEIGIESSTKGNAWLDNATRSLLNLIFQKSDNDQFINGYRHFMNYLSYHSPTGNRNIAAEIYRELCQGKIIIVDLSVGHPMVRDNLSTQIASYILNTSMQTFTQGEAQGLPNILIYIEEAHNLIGKKDDLTSIWPRIAKEGAKFRIGLVYATQEPSSIHPNILSNTENWFVTHLNNDDELKVLAKFYDFGDFSLSLKRAQDVGFARVKTLSSAFVIPIQIKLFDPAALKQALEALRFQQDTASR